MLKIGGGAVESEGDEPEAYIESDQTQYIKTDVYPSTLMRLEIDFQLTKIHNDFYLLGSNATPYWDLYVNGNYGFTTICHTGWSAKTTDNYWATTERTKVVMDRKAGTWSITRATDAKSGTYGAADATTPSVPFGIFARQEAEGASNWPHYPKSTTTATGGMTPMRIYSIRIYENEKLEFELLPYKNGDVTGLKDTLSGKVYTSDEGNPFVVGGKGYDGTKTFATALAGDASIAAGDSVTFGPVFAPGAIRYEWMRGGVPLAETGDTVTLGWERVKGDHTQEISVTPVYSVYGTEVKGEPSTATLTNEPLGMAILIQ